jgi:hypothetical protein
MKKAAAIATSPRTTSVCVSPPLSVTIRISPACRRRAGRGRPFWARPLEASPGLVLVEALASGCRLISTELAGVRDELACGLRSALELVPLPPLGRVDEPLEEDLPAFADDLAGALLTALARPPPAGADVEFPGALEQLTWGAGAESPSAGRWGRSGVDAADDVACRANLG